ncbi:MAG: DUF4760 domain-containing protein [Rhizobiaceae bacterium]|nr:DUF4760 domain-containing protein [Rhizobiaceae bacterium]
MPINTQNATILTTADMIQIGLLLLVVLELVVAIILHRTNQKSQLKEAIEDHERRKREATFQFIESVSAKYKKAIATLNRKFPTNEIIPFETMAHDDMENIKIYLNEMERLAIGVHTDTFDRGIIERMMATSMRKNSRKFSAYIKDRQDKNSKLFNEFQTLVREL